jgi:hypothetical protein
MALVSIGRGTLPKTLTMPKDESESTFKMMQRKVFSLMKTPRAVRLKEALQLSLNLGATTRNPNPLYPLKVGLHPC